MLFCRDIKICLDLHTLWKSLGKKKGCLGQKQCCLGKKGYSYMVCIAYQTELNVQICNYAQKQHICRKNSKHAFDESFYGHFAPAEVLPTSATLLTDTTNICDMSPLYGDSHSSSFVLLFFCLSVFLSLCLNINVAFKGTFHQPNKLLPYAQFCLH